MDPLPTHLRRLLTRETLALGFSQVRVSRPTLTHASQALDQWLAAGHHGTMNWLERHRELRRSPQQLLPGTQVVISVSLPYHTEPISTRWQQLQQPEQGYIAQYALGDDYHRVVRQRLKQLAERLTQVYGPFQWRPFSDSAPLFEVEIGQQSGLGWRGKHTLLLQRQGSLFFLGELLCDLPLEPDPPGTDHCGSCRACLDICPTQAILAPYQLDARRCIAYLTIEHDGPIPESLRPLIGNRIYGCDDCQLICPWNRFATPALTLPFFARRHALQATTLSRLMAWTPSDFETFLQRSPIRRIGHIRWLRNIAIALGNGPPSSEAFQALALHHQHPAEQVRESVAWAWQRLHARRGTQPPPESQSRIRPIDATEN
ncbi:MAG: tRNA epoxyqueuosine(34) reductase QueG [Betaproteobacteria bacterium]|nr:tRNA epoxyqueuosine(34) reductase QueG [Betaproteobacteria bacterium]